jgi:hypothetical protein
MGVVWSFLGKGNPTRIKSYWTLYIFPSAWIAWFLREGSKDGRNEEIRK